MRMLDVNPLFSVLNASQRSDVVNAMRRQHFVGGDIIIRQGAPAEELYFLHRGACQVMRLVPLVPAPPGRGAAARGGLPQHGVPLHISSISQGEVFGEVGLVRRTPRTVTVVAERTCEVRWHAATCRSSSEICHVSFII